MRRVLKTGAVGAMTVLLALSTLHAAGQPVRTPPDEIRNLLAAMERSGCDFYRNGRWYTSAEARAHLTHKLAEIEKRQPVRGPNEFIDTVASRSSISGEPYRVRCPGAEPVPSSIWFRQTLERLRQVPQPTR